VLPETTIHAATTATINEPGTDQHHNVMGACNSSAAFICKVNQQE